MINLKFVRKFLSMFLLSLVILMTSAPLSAASEEKVDPKKKAISYNLVGRLGNRIITYLCAKWIAQQYDLPFLYVPFPYSEQFVFHEQEKYYKADWEPFFSRKIFATSEKNIPNEKNSSLILINFFYSKAPQLLYRTFWSDPNFKKAMGPLLQPRFPIKTVDLAEGKLNILAHVRTGGDYDSKKTQLRYPNKFPPHSFYISAIATLSKLFDHRPIYVYIMTDDLHPEKIAQDYMTALSHLTNIEIGYRNDNADPSLTVMEDFFSVPKFDCLIRGFSTFTIAAALNANFQAVVTPYQTHVENGEVIVDKIKVQCSDPKLKAKTKEILSN